jgi:hypothetical protein
MEAPYDVILSRSPDPFNFAQDKLREGSAKNLYYEEQDPLVAANVSSG